MNYLTADKIRVVGRFSIQNIKEIEINVKTNEHPTIYVKGIIPADVGMEEIKDKCFKERIALVELDEEGKEKDYAIFDGIILNAEVKEEGNFFEVEIWGISASYLFDIEKKSRSFQNVSMTYSDILKEVIGEHKYIFTSGEDRAIGKPLIQYNETDWEFARRLASHFNKSIQSDIITGNPRIWFGVRLGNQPEKEYESLFDTNTYSVEISNKYYEVGESLGLSKLYYIVYKLKDGRNFHIGDKVLFQDKKLIICEKEVKFEKGELVFYYTLARENYLSVIEYYNIGFTGLSLLGEIIKTENETVYLKLDIDGKNGEYSYKWTPTSGSLMYCMPKVGTKASLYFSSADERSGIATNSPRTNGGSDSKSEVDTKGFSNVQERGMITEHGKRMDLYPDIMRFSATGEVDSETGEIIKPLELLFDDEDGIKAESHKSLKLMSLEDIILESKTKIFGYSPNEINLLRTAKLMEQQLQSIVPIGTYTMQEALNNQKGEVDLSPMTADEDTTLMIAHQFDLYSYKNHIMEGREYDIHEPIDDAPEEGKFEWGKLIDNVIGGLAIVGFTAFIIATLPVSGTVLMGAVVAGVSGVIGLAVSDYISGNVSDSEDYVMVGFTSTICGALTADIKNPIVDNVLAGVLERSIEAIFEPDMSLSEKFLHVLSPTRIITDVGTALVFEGVKGGAKVVGKGVGKGVSKLASNLSKGLDGIADKMSDGIGKNTIKKISTVLKKLDPVDIITGSFLIEQCDLIINDTLEDFALERLYESIYSDISPIGKGWNLTIFSHLEFELNYIKVYTLDNRLEIFQMTEDNNYKNIRDNDQTYILKAIDTGYSFYNNITQTTMIYKNNGKLSYVVDKVGNKREYIYENNELKKITFASGQYFEFTFSNGKITEIKDNLNRCIEYTYNGDYLTSAKIPNGGVETYSYNEQGFIKSVTNADGVTSIQNEYDEKGRVIYQKLSTGQEYFVEYDEERKINTCSIPKLNRVEKYHYNNQNVVEKIEYQDGTSEERRYDTWENLVYKKDRNGNITRYVYNKFGLKTEEHLPSGLETFYEYDEKGNCIKEWDNSGKEYKNIYDDRNNLIKNIAKIDDERELIISYEYDNKGRIIKETDPNGNIKYFEYNSGFNKTTKYTTNENHTYNYTYDIAGRCLTAENEYGVREFAYDPMDIVIESKDQLGNLTRYEYDQMFNLKKEIFPNNIEKGIGTSYEYDPFHKLLKKEDAEGNVFATPRDLEGNIAKEINPNSYDEKTNDGEGISYEYDEYDNKIKTIYPDGSIERIKYDANGNIIKRIAPQQYDEKTDDGAGYTYEYDSSNRLIQVTDPRHNVIKRYVYDLRGNVIKEIDGVGYRTGENDEVRKGIVYKYNKMNWLIEKREPITKDKKSYALTTYEYDLAGNLIKENRYIDYQTEESYDGEMHTISFEYDKDNRRIKVSDCTGAVVSYTYNCQNKVASEKRKIDNTRWQETFYIYDKVGRIVEVKQVLDEETTSSLYYEYDKNGNIVKITTPNGYEVIKEYDSIDRLISERHIEKGKIDNTTKFKYDKAGNLVEITDNKGRKTTIEYDLMNREIRKIEKDGSITRKYYNQNGLLSMEIKPEQYDAEKDNGDGYRYYYNPQGKLTDIIAPNGATIQKNLYDENGRLIEQLDGEKIGVKFKYDLAGNRTLIETKGKARQSFKYDTRGNIVGIEDGEYNKTNYVLDKWGRITGIEKADGSTEKYTYDYAGNITSSTDGENNTTYYNYNIAGQIESIVDPMGEKEQYFYDLENRLKEKIDRNGNIVQYGYNMYSSLTYRKAKGSDLQEIYNYTPEGLLESAISNGMHYNYTYDIMGRLTSKQASGRTLISYEYDKNGNKIKEIDVTGKVAEFSYNNVDLLEKVVHNGVDIATYDYYNNGLVKELNNGSLQQKYDYDSDKNLSRLRVVHNDNLLTSNHYSYDGNGNRLAKQVGDDMMRYSYTPTGQLKHAKYLTYEEELFYDKAGNRTRRIVNGSEELYSYDARNRLTQFTKDGQTTDFEWDNAGNLLKDDKANYSYDEFNRTTRVETFDGNVQINRYDAEGLRYEMEENGQLVQFIFNTDREVIAEQEENKWTIYIRGSELLASSSDYAKTYYHYATDEMGSITHIIDDKNILNHYEYDVWGNVVKQKETVKNRFKFTGEQLDPITQQYYLRARFYNPVIARFTQEDTYRGDGLNLYAYCRNNPIKYVDPTGNICENVANDIQRIRGTAIDTELKVLAEYEENINKFMLEEMDKKVLELVDSVNNKTQSKSAIGPCLSQVYDPLTGKIEYGYNFKTGKSNLIKYEDWLKNDADELIQILEKNYRNKIESGEIIKECWIDERYAGHSEIVALDKILKNRRELGLQVSMETLSELYLYNVDMTKVFKFNEIIPKNRCPNCEYLTNGINILNHN